MSANNTNTNPSRCRSYADHRQFVLKKLNHATCPHGRDFPPNERRCCICHEDIHNNSTVAQVCPQSPKHIYHWLCMIQWVNTWNDEGEEHNRGCPTCRAEMLIVNETEYSRHHPLPEPSKHVIKQRQQLAAGWDLVLAARSTMVSSSDGGYVLPPLDDNTVDRALPIRYAIMGDQGSSRDLAVTLMALADPLQIEVMRSAAYMTDNPDQLNGLLNFVDELRFAFEALDPPVEDPEITPQATPQASRQASQAAPQAALQAAPQPAPQAVSMTHQMEAQHIPGVEDEYATQEEGEELEEDEGKEGEDDGGDEEEASEGRTLVDESEDRQGDTEDTDGEMTLLQEMQDTDPEKPQSPERDSQMEEQDSQMEEYDSEEYDSQENSDDQEMSDPDEEDKPQEMFMSDAVEQMRDEESEGSVSPEWENVI